MHQKVPHFDEKMLMLHKKKFHVKKKQVSATHTKKFHVKKNRFLLPPRSFMSKKAINFFRNSGHTILQHKQSMIKKQILFCWYENTQQKPKYNNIYTTDLKACSYIKKTFQRRCLSEKRPKYLRTPFLTEQIQWLLRTYDIPFLVLFIQVLFKKRK